MSDGLTEAEARVLVLVETWEDAQRYNREHMGSLMRDTPGPADFRAALDNPGNVR